MGRARAGCAAQRAAALERVTMRKRKAVEDEDFELAARLKRCEAELAARSSPTPAAPAGELERVKAEKREAIMNEDFEKAAALKVREQELESGALKVREQELESGGRHLEAAA